MVIIFSCSFFSSFFFFAVVADSFADFSLRLPGFNIPIVPYLSEKNHDLRYVLRNRETGDVYLVVLFRLVLLGTEDEPKHREEVVKASKEIKEKGLQSTEKLGKYDWQPEGHRDGQDEVD